jgi:hypothetical protein
MIVGTELVGLMACATIFVEGLPGTPEALTQAERDAVVLGVIKAEQTLGRLARAKSPNQFLQCSFFNEWRTVAINPGFISPPTNTTANKAQRDSEIQSREPQWSLPAMAALGFPFVMGAPDPIDRFCDALLHKDWLVPQKPRRAFVLFVTKFPTGWIAYASLGGNRITVQLDWISDTSGDFRGTGVGGYGIANLDRVVAHEMGHIFGGLDEYAGCNSVESSGPLGTLNGNCVTFNPFSVDCLMKKNTEDLCPFSVSHVGWVDSDFDGLVDAAPPRVDSMFPSIATPGDTIRLHGSGLGDARSIVFTGIGAADFTIAADNELTVTVPPGSGADIDVFVTTPLGITSPGPALLFTYV